jgi:hypothetical protein
VCVLVVAIGAFAKLGLGELTVGAHFTAHGAVGSAPPRDAWHSLAGGMLAPRQRETVRGTFRSMPDHVMNYVESDVPAGLTLIEWRRVGVAASARRRRSVRSLPAIRRGLAFA